MFVMQGKCLFQDISRPGLLWYIVWLACCFMVMASKRSTQRGTVEDVVNGKKLKGDTTNTTGQPKTGQVERVNLTMSDPTASQTKKGTSPQTRSSSNFIDFKVVPDLSAYVQKSYHLLIC